MPYKQRNRILVTGAQGQLGTEICHLLGVRAIASDLPALDLTGREDVLSAACAFMPDAIINTAAFVLADQAELAVTECRLLNVDAVGHLIEASERLDCPILHVSSDYVFGGDTARWRPYRETDMPAPLSVYGRSKLDGECLLAAYKKHFIVRTCGLFGVPGKRTTKRNFVDTMLHLGAEYGTVRVVDDQTCSPSHVPDVARAIVHLIDTDAYGLYHVVSNGCTTWYNMAENIFRVAGMAVDLRPISTAEYQSGASRPAYSVLETAKYHALGGPPMSSWQDGLRRYLRRYDRMVLRKIAALSAPPGVRTCS